MDRHSLSPGWPLWHASCRQSASTIVHKSGGPQPINSSRLTSSNSQHPLLFTHFIPLASLTMILLVHRIERQFQRNLQQHVFANELRVKVQRMKECFPGNSLPLPTAEVIAAWNDLPNDTVDILPMSMKTGLVFLRAPPPTPTGLAFDTDDATSDGSSLDDSPIDNWLLVDDIDSPTPDAVAPQARERSTTGDSDSMSRCSYSLDQRSNEEDSFHSIDSGSPSSDQENLSSSSEVSPTPVGFYNMVNQWLLDYRARGMGPFAESLVAFGVVSTGTVPLTSRIARAVIRKVARISYTEGKSLENTIRSTALAAFKKEWKSVSQYCGLLSLRLGQRSRIYRTIPGWTCHPLGKIPCHLLHTVSILPASWVAYTMQGYSAQRIFIFACSF